jgi:hypothetical protein
MLNLKTNTSIKIFLGKLVKIFKTNYCKDEEFKKELSSSLLQATGNDNLGSLCREIIDKF